MAYDVARVRGLHPSLGDGWVHMDPQNGMLLPDTVSRAVSTAFRGSFRFNLAMFELWSIESGPTPHRISTV